jgi:hypothetical protein
MTQAITSLPAMQPGRQQRDVARTLSPGAHAEVDQTMSVFYRIVRAGAARLPDGGGPFGFDIAVALMVDHLIAACGCDAVIETGCFMGDTTDYLARRHPGLPVFTCDIDPDLARFTAQRVAGCPNAAVTCEDSPAMLERVLRGRARPVAFLDAHWAQEWPLVAELNLIVSAGGIAVVHDFDIGHDRFSYDAYGDLACGPGVLTRMAEPPDRYWVLDPAAPLPVPCLQVGRRAGVAVVTAPRATGPADASPYLAARRLPAEAAP